MFRRKTNAALNGGRRWLSHSYHSSGPRKSSSSYALARSAAVVATSVAAATIASQKFIEGPIYNDASRSSLKANVKTVRVGSGGDTDGDELRLLVWGSNRCVQYIVCPLIRAFFRILTTVYYYE